MTAAAALPGIFFCFVAFLLLIFVSVSSPTWESVYFLDAGTGAGRVRFGAFGYTGSGTSVGYKFPAAFRGFNKGKLSSVLIQVYHDLTSALIIHPFAAALSGLAVLLGIWGAANHRSGTVFVPLVSGLALLLTLVAWIIDMVLWGISRKIFRDNGVSAQYGNANWLTLGALIALFIGSFASCCVCLQA